MVPYMTEYRSKISEYFLDNFYAGTGKTRPQTDVKYFDNSKDKRVVENPHLLMNSNHFNYVRLYYLHIYLEKK